MAPYVDPRLADHVEGLEQRIIEVSQRIEEFGAHDATWWEAEALRERRFELILELADASDALTTPRGARSVVVHARRVA